MRSRGWGPPARTRALYKKRKKPGCVFSPSLPLCLSLLPSPSLSLCRSREKMPFMSQKGALTRHQGSGTLIWDFLAAVTLRNRCLLVKPPIYHILSAQGLSEENLALGVSPVMRLTCPRVLMVRALFKKRKAPHMIFLKSILVTSYSEALVCPRCCKSLMPLLTSLCVGDNINPTQTILPHSNPLHLQLVMNAFIQ